MGNLLFLGEQEVWGPPPLFISVQRFTLNNAWGLFLVVLTDHMEVGMELRAAMCAKHVPESLVPITILLHVYSEQHPQMSINQMLCSIIKNISFWIFVSFFALVFFTQCLIAKLCHAHP